MSPIDGSSLGLALPRELTGVSEARSVIEPAPGAEGFGEILSNAIGGVNQSANAAHHAAAEFAAGRRDDLHGTMIAVQKADIELHMLGTVRNKVMDTFYEIWRMQI
jgi:flagellar hook-basal body complex protein FliE